MSLRRVQNMFMPKNINSVTIMITLEGIEKRKTWKKWQQNSLNNHASIYKVNGFYFPSMKIHKSWLEITKSCHLSFQTEIVENMKGKFDKGYLRVEINSAIAKLTVEQCVWLEAAKLTWTSPPAIELLHAAFTSEVSLNQPLTFVDFLSLVEKIENLDFLPRLLCLQPWFRHENGVIISFTDAARKRRERWNGF